MIDKIRTSLNLAVVALFAVTCVGQQNSQAAYTEPAADQAASQSAPDEVVHSFDSMVFVESGAPAAKTPVAEAPKAEPSKEQAPKAEMVQAKEAPAPVPAPAKVEPQPQMTAQLAPPTEAAATAAPAVPFQQRHPRYLLRAGDVFDVNFEYSPEFNQTVTVQPDGYISLREAGDIYVQGLSLEQLNQAIRKGYAEVLHSPSIAIVPKNFEQPYVVVGGEVKTPGKFDLRGPMTVAEAVALAGGFTEAAKHSHVLLFHRESPDQAIVVRTLNIKRMLNREDLKEDAQLRPGDMIYVPQNTMSKIKGYVVPRASVGPNSRPTL
jgi:polysaccharide export outer membrane protein